MSPTTASKPPCDLIWTCPNCRQRVPMRASEFPIYCSCGYHGELNEAAPGRDKPRLWKRLANYREAKRRWKEAGRPKRTTAEIEQLFAVCAACPLLVNGVCTHAACGCHVSDNPRAFFNKLAWATEHCPLQKW